MVGSQSIFQKMWSRSLAVASAASTTLPTGDRFDLPPSALESLMENTTLPLVFRLTVDARRVYASVREFTAPEGSVVLSEWLRVALNMEHGDNVSVRLTTLPVGLHAVFQPLSSLSSIPNIR
jgi:hypothetical protein